MNIIFMGAPGAGKGTQAARTSTRYSIPTISTGELIRDAIKNETAMGLKAKVFINRGELLSDDIVNEIVRERIQQDDCKNGFILDGYPRTIPQAEELENMGVIIDHVVCINVPDEEIVNRMKGRRVCKECGATYHVVSNQPEKTGVCDKCGAELIQRKDDDPDTVLNRLKVYHKETEPLIEYYKQQGKLRVVRGADRLEETTERVKHVLEDNA